MNEELLDFIKQYIDSELDKKKSDEHYIYFEHRKSPKQYFDEILIFIIKLLIIFLFISLITY
jgi:hypothetical protein